MNLRSVINLIYVSKLLQMKPPDHARGVINVNDLINFNDSIR